MMENKENKLEKDDIYVHVDLCFKLPKNFKGDLNDVLESVLKYRRSIKNHDKDYQYDNTLDLYANWWNQVHTTNRPFLAQVGCGKYNGVTFDEIKIQ